MPIYDKYYTIFTEGNRRVMKSLDIVKLTKDIRYLKLLTMTTIEPDIETKFQIYHCSKNIIKGLDEHQN